MLKLAVVLDDSLLLRNLFKRILTSLSFEVVALEKWEGEASLTLVKELQPHLVVVDLHFDNSSFSGLDIIEVLRRDELTQHTPIVLATADFITVKSVALQLETQMVKVLLKPFVLNEFLSLVHEISPPSTKPPLTLNQTDRSQNPPNFLILNTSNDNHYLSTASKPTALISSRPFVT